MKIKSGAGVLFAIGFAVAGMAAPQLVAAAGDGSYRVVDGGSIPQSLTGKPGDPKKGRAVAINRKQGNCLACHAMPIQEQPFHGKVGPDLSGVASRYSEGEIRLRVVDPKVTNPATIMPAFYRSTGFHRVAKKFEAKSILTAEQTEDVVAYLMTLK